MEKLRAADMAPLVSASIRVGLAGLTRRPMTLAFGTSSCSNSSRFGVTSALSCVTPVMFSPGWLRLLTRPSWIGSKPVSKTIGMVVFRGPRCERGRCAGRGDHGHLLLQKIGHQGRQPIGMVLCPTIFDFHIAAIDV